GGRVRWKADGSFNGLSYSPDGRRLAAVRDDGLRVLEAEGGRELWKADGFFRGMSYSPDGRRLATTDEGGAQVWEADSGRQLWKADGFFSGPSASYLSYSPRGGSALWQEFSDRGVYVFSGPSDAPGLLLSRRRAIQDTRAWWHSATAARCEAGGQWFAAAFHWKQHARLDPSQGDPRYRRGRAMARLGQIKKAEPEFQAALERGHTLPAGTVADCHAMLGQFTEAAKLLQEVSGTPAAPAEALEQTARLRLGIGDLAGYREACKAQLQRFGEVKASGVMNRIAWTCAMGPDALADLKPVIDLARQNIKAAPQTWVYHGSLGAVLYRAGQHAEAEAELEAAIRLHDQGGSPLTLVFLAMTQHQLGKPDEARKALEQAVKLTERDPPWHWADKLERQLLRREAEALLGEKAKDKE
ncbi:MAG: tetratricopeptide repeat protein, partial [Gemmataceae bacterium]